VADEPAVVALADVREALARVLDAAEAELGAVVDLDADHYWALDAGAAFDLSKDPEIKAGQVSDDVETVRELLVRERGEIFLWHDLEHLVGILQRIAALARP
jgi:hypothetical protein